MTTALRIAGVGMVTGIGATTPETTAALRAGKRQVAASSLVDLHGDRIVGSFVLPVSPSGGAVRRAFTLGWAAVRDCLAEAGPWPGSTALLVCVPVPWGTWGDVLAPVIGESADPWPAVRELLAEHLEAQGIPVPAALRCLFAHGHAAGALALQRASELFERGEAAQVVIVGLDSHGERATLERLALLGWLRSRCSPGGMIPGEAAAALCLRPASANEGGGAVVRGVGVARETDSPSTARALTAAVSAAIAAWGGEVPKIGAVAIDLNGQRERAKEWTFTAMRTLHRHHAVPALLHPADRTGDVGAASVPLLLGLLARGGHVPGVSLAVASSLDGLRGAVLLEVDP